ncbi:MAG: tetratricopeptide repeat protein [bacterium]|nr:tetratricopeptide repeat protein [bacterium]
MLIKARVLPVLVLWLATAASLAAQTTFGRVTIKIVDEQDQPLPGVTIIATSSSLVDYREEKTTDKKGKVNFGFTDATHTYDFRFEKEGFNPADTRIKPEIKATTFRTFSLDRLSSAPPPAQEGTTTRVIYTPAEKVFNEGAKLLESGDRDAAKAKFLEALEKDADMALAHSALGGVYLAEGDQQAALAAADRLIEIDPRNTRGHRIRYEAYKALGKKKEADEALKELSQLDSQGDAAALMFNEAVDALDVGDTNTAKARFLEALTADPGLVPALSALAGIYSREGSNAEAAEMAEKLLAAEPGNLKALRIRHDAYRGLGDAEKTKAAAAALAEADPKAAAGGMFDRGIALFEGGDATAAVAEFEKVIEVDPGHTRAHYRLGLSYISLGETAKAKQHLQKFIEMAPDDPEVAAARDMLGYLE